MSDEPMVFTREEMLSYLPMGWVLPPDEEGQPTGEGGWSATVLDLADQEWRLEVAPGEVEALGRIGALKAAFARLHRGALGRAGLFG